MLVFLIPCCVVVLLGLTQQADADGSAAAAAAAAAAASSGGSWPDPPEPPSTCVDPAVAKFAASFFTAMLITGDPDVIFSLEKPGSEASPIFYDVIFSDLDQRGGCNAHAVAAAVSDTVAKYDWFYVSNYLENKGVVVGYFLLYNGVLTCDNAIEYALNYFKLVKIILSKLDPTEFESYVIAISNGVVDFVVEQDWIELEEGAADLAYLFHETF